MKENQVNNVEKKVNYNGKFSQSRVYWTYSRRGYYGVVLFYDRTLLRATIVLMGFSTRAFHTLPFVRPYTWGHILNLVLFHWFHFSFQFIRKHDCQYWPCGYVKSFTFSLQTTYLCQWISRPLTLTSRFAEAMTRLGNILHMIRAARALVLRCMGKQIAAARREVTIWTSREPRRVSREFRRKCCANINGSIAADMLERFVIGLIIWAILYNDRLLNLLNLSSSVLSEWVV